MPNRKQIVTAALLLTAGLMLTGCGTAQAQCPGGSCARGAGIWSPWVGAWYYTAPCQTCTKPKTEPAVPEATQQAEPPAPEETEPAAPPRPCDVALALINAQRTALGLSELKLDETLCEGARKHCVFMRSAGLRHAYGIGGREAIASGVATPSAAVNLWLNSTGHRAILLGPGTIVGIGTDGGYWTLRVR